MTIDQDVQGVHSHLLPRKLAAYKNRWYRLHYRTENISQIRSPWYRNGCADIAVCGLVVGTPGRETSAKSDILGIGIAELMKLCDLVVTI